MVLENIEHYTKDEKKIIFIFLIEQKKRELIELQNEFDKLLRIGLII